MINRAFLFSNKTKVINCQNQKLPQMKRLTYWITKQYISSSWHYLNAFPQVINKSILTKSNGLYLPTQSLIITSSARYLLSAGAELLLFPPWPSLILSTLALWAQFQNPPGLLPDTCSIRMLEINTWNTADIPSKPSLFPGFVLFSFSKLKIVKVIFYLSLPISAYNQILSLPSPQCLGPFSPYITIIPISNNFED